MARMSASLRTLRDENHTADRCDNISFSRLVQPDLGSYFAREKNVAKSAKLVVSWESVGSSGDRLLLLFLLIFLGSLRLLEDLLGDRNFRHFNIFELAMGIFVSVDHLTQQAVEHYGMFTRHSYGDMRVYF